MAPKLSLLASVGLLLQFNSLTQADVVSVSGTPPTGTGATLPGAFISYSIELAFFPDFAGNTSSPNTFSDNLLNNIGNLTGTKPYVRVGGNTQDFAIFDAALAEAITVIYAHSGDDYPDTVTIGTAFFESYLTWPNTKFTHGFNMKAADTLEGWKSIIASVPHACKALSGGNLLAWEYGNEPDLYKNSWTGDQYISEWLNGTREINSGVLSACPGLSSTPGYGFIAPSFSSTGTRLNTDDLVNPGLNTDRDLQLIANHLYMGGANKPGVTLQGTLMNHQHTISSVEAQVKEMNNLAFTNIPYILGEANSLYHEGSPGLSNTFGAALWGVDFLLWCASVGIRRVHMHQGTSYRYGSWQPINTAKETIGTKAPYYGNIAAAAMLGNLLSDEVQIANILLQNSTYDAGYAAYVNGKLSRIAVINLRAYNYTEGGLGSTLNPMARPSQNYSFDVPSSSGQVAIQRLYANGSDAISGITWDGWSYNWELDKGKPVRLNNVTTGERTPVTNGIVTDPDMMIHSLMYVIQGLVFTKSKPLTLFRLAYQIIANLVSAGYLT